ncbi:MAG: cysteine--tRNA ligase [Myxococcales bacterium]|nr:cysteine--tRNA ligase [Myxococcales bacterium]
MTDTPSRAPRAASFHVHDTLSNSLIPLPQRVAGECSLYACGPTVYNFIHLGNARPAVVFDTLVRHLRASGTKVTYVRNFTDIDDKIIQAATQTGESPRALAERFVQAYREDVTALGCVLPDHQPRVSEHLPEIIAMIETLIAKGHAYVSEGDSKGDVYFRVKSFADYGKLSKQTVEGLERGDVSRKNDAEVKESKLDFALWKSAKSHEQPDARWPSPWGEGRPGWHIECSAMAKKWLGESFDLHGGGLDLTFPHHENEIAQSEASNGVPFASSWMHNAMILVNGKKMAKSEAANYPPEIRHAMILRNLLALVDAEAVRLWLLGTHYRADVNFEVAVDMDAQPGADGLRPTKFPLLDESERRVEYFYDTRARMNARAQRAQGAKEPSDAHPIRAIVRAFDAALDDDLNTPVALAQVAELYKRANELCDQNRKDPVETRALLEALEHTASVLGIANGDPATFARRVRDRRAKQRNIDVAEIDGLVQERTTARKNKDFARSDAIRATLSERGIEVRDEAGGSVWRIV